MFSLSQTRLLNVIAAGALATIAFVNTPASAGGADAKMRPAGPHEPILASVGVRRVVASFAPEFGRCAIGGTLPSAGNGGNTAWDSVGAP